MGEPAPVPVRRGALMVRLAALSIALVVAHLATGCASLSTLQYRPQPKRIDIGFKIMERESTRARESSPLARTAGKTRQSEKV